MVFCGQCGYQLSPGSTTCPRCGAPTDADQIAYDPGTYNPTEISHAVLPSQPAPPPTFATRQNQVESAGPLILGPVIQDEQQADATTVMMGSQPYMPHPSYPTYPGMAQQGGYGYAAGYQPYQGGQSAAVAAILEASRKGKITSLLLILFGILLLIAAILVFLLNQQGVIFPT